MKTSATIASAAAVLMMAAGATSAYAGGGHKGFSNSFKFHHHHRHFRIFRDYDYRDCDYYLDRWEDTGRFFWKRKYYLCKGWW